VGTCKCMVLTLPVSYRAAGWLAVIMACRQSNTVMGGIWDPQHTLSASDTGLAVINSSVLQ